MEMKYHYPKLYTVPFTYLKNVKFIFKEKSMKSFLPESASTTQCASQDSLSSVLPDWPVAASWQSQRAVLGFALHFK